jgi:hypothetical protein
MKTTQTMQKEGRGDIPQFFRLSIEVGNLDAGVVVLQQAARGAGSQAGRLPLLFRVWTGDPLGAGRLLSTASPSWS